MDLYAFFAGIAAAGIWGGMYVVSKVVLDIIPPYSLLALRLILGALSLLVLIAVRGGWKLKRKQVFQVFGIGFIGFGISLGMQFSGTKLSSAANAALVTSASPVFILVFGVLLLRERVSPRRVLALLLASIGVVAVVDPRSLVIGGGEWAGDLILVGAALTWGLYSVLIKAVAHTGPIIEISFFAFLGGLPLSLTISAFERQTIGWQAITPGLVLGVLYLGIISTALAMYLWNTALARLDAGVVSLLFFAQPVVGASLGAILLGEVLDSGFWIGAALISIGLILAAREQRALAGRARGKE